MPYVLSKLANNQIYTKFAKGQNGLNLIVKQVAIKGGADVTNKNLVTPQGIVTEVSSDDLEVLKENKDFQRHLDKGLVNYFAAKPNIEKKAELMQKDNSRQLTKDDYKKKAKTEPTTGEL